MKQDIIERLRTKSIVRWIHNPGATPEMRGHKPDPEAQEAAAEIERLRAVEKRFNYLQAQFTQMVVGFGSEKAWYWEGSPARLKGDTMTEALDYAMGAKT